jgi:hypothetical protein
LLGLDLGGAADAGLITAVLTRCARDRQGKPVPAERLWGLRVGQRVLALLKVAEAGGLDGIEVPLLCPTTGCGADIAIALTPTELADLAEGQGSGPVSVDLGDGLLRLRLPTGDDQRAWAQCSYPSRDQAVAAMIEGLRLDGPQRALDEGERALVEAELDAHDPLVRCAVQVRCPECGGLGVHEIDLAGILLRRLRTAQAALLEAIHRLARHYHWSEAEIVSLPPWRRAHYLALLEREGSP